MLDIAGVMPWAQLNTTVTGAGSAPAEQTGAVGAAAAPAVTTGSAGVAGTQGTVAQSGPATQGKPQDAPSSPWGGIVLPMIIILVAFYFFMFRGQRKEEKKRKEMISTIKKGDRVVTIGGMLASVVAVEGDEVVLKIDESANVKARYTKASVQQVLERDEKK